MINAPERSFILLEDIDAAFRGRTQTDETGWVPSSLRLYRFSSVLMSAFDTRPKSSLYRHLPQSFTANVTFSGLLNAVDGVASSSSQRLLFMTTNHIERLDPALIRPGRVDLKEYIGDASCLQAQHLFERFYSDSVSPSQLKDMLDELGMRMDAALSAGRTLSMASLQGHFIRHDAREAIQTLENLMSEAAQDKAAIETQQRYRPASYV